MTIFLLGGGGGGGDCVHKENSTVSDNRGSHQNFYLCCTWRENVSGTSGEARNTDNK